MTLTNVELVFDVLLWWIREFKSCGIKNFEKFPTKVRYSENSATLDFILHLIVDGYSEEIFNFYIDLLTERVVKNSKNDDMIVEALLIKHLLPSVRMVDTSVFFEMLSKLGGAEMRFKLIPNWQ